MSQYTLPSMTGAHYGQIIQAGAHLRQIDTRVRLRISLHQLMHRATIPVALEDAEDGLSAVLDSNYKTDTC